MGQQDDEHVEIHPTRVIEQTWRYRRERIFTSSEINSSDSPKTLSWTKVRVGGILQEALQL
jgi:hypothetical protein